MASLEAEYREDWERQRKSVGIFRYAEMSDRYLSEEEKFYSKAKRTPALDAAAQAFCEKMNQEREKQMSTQLVSQETTSLKAKNRLELGTLESIFIQGDISKMNEVQRIEYTREVCKSLGLNPLTNPFDYISFQGKIQLYAKKGCTDQLRGLYGITTHIMSTTIEDGILTVHARAKNHEGREDDDIGCVSIQGLKGEALANAKMKAVTKAKRRVTLSICGLGMLDETETDSIPGAVKGEKVFSQDQPPAKPPQIPAKPSLPPEIAAEMKKILALKNDLKISDDEFKAELHKEFKTDSLKGLKLEQLKIISGYLEAAKGKPPQVEMPAEWEQEAMGPLVAEQFTR